jgi:hypothetical protein
MAVLPTYYNLSNIIFNHYLKDSGIILFASQN